MGIIYWDDCIVGLNSANKYKHLVILIVFINNLPYITIFFGETL